MCYRLAGALPDVVDESSKYEDDQRVEEKSSLDVVEDVPSVLCPQHSTSAALKPEAAHTYEISRLESFFSVVDSPVLLYPNVPTNISYYTLSQSLPLEKPYSTVVSMSAAGTPANDASEAVKGMSVILEQFQDSIRRDRETGRFETSKSFEDACEAALGQMVKRITSLDKATQERYTASQKAVAEI